MTFGIPLGNIWDAFGGQLVDFWGTFLRHLGNLRGTFGGPLGDILAQRELFDRQFDRRPVYVTVRAAFLKLSVVTCLSN